MHETTYNIESGIVSERVFADLGINEIVLELPGSFSVVEIRQLTKEADGIDDEHRTSIVITGGVVDWSRA